MTTDGITSTRDNPASTSSTPVTTDGIMGTSDSAPIGVIIGGAVGGVAMVLLVGVAITALCVTVAKHQLKIKHGIQEFDGMGYENAIYEGRGRKDNI